MLLGPLLMLLAVHPAPAPGSVVDPCPGCGMSRATIRRSLDDLHAAHWRDRDRAARSLAAVRWECHPEVVAALAESLRDDGKPKVRAEAAETLARMVPNLPASHVALVASARDDPAASVRKHAGHALAAKGRRCVVACPICGPIPTGGGISGPSLALPELVGPPSPTTRPLPPLPE